MLIRIIAWFLDIMPEPLVRAKALVWSWIWFYIVPVRRKVMNLNLTLAFPELSVGERRKLIRKTMHSFMPSLVEFGRLRHVTEKFMRKRVTIEGEPVLRSLLARNRGVVVISGHFGNWEVMGAVCRQMDLPISYIVKRVKDQNVDDLINGWRKDIGVEIIYARESNTKIAEHLKRNRLVAFMVDQDAGKRGVRNVFVGHPASTPRGAAVYALRTGAPVMLAMGLREGTRFRIVFEEVKLPADAGLSEEGITKAMQAMTSILESWVRKYPGQYMWMHHRWRTWLREEGRL